MPENDSPSNVPVNPRAFQHGHPVSLMTSARQYLNCNLGKGIVKTSASRCADLAISDEVWYIERAAGPGIIKSGDDVSFRTRAPQYLNNEEGHGETVQVVPARSLDPKSDELWKIQKIEGAGEIAWGDAVTLSTRAEHALCCPGGQGRVTVTSGRNVSREENGQLWYVEPFPKFDATTWRIDNDSLRVMSDLQIYSRPFLSIVIKAIDCVRDSLNEQLCHEAVKLRDANPPPAGYSFSEADLVRLLRFGDLHYRTFILQIHAYTGPRVFLGHSENMADIYLHVPQFIEFLSWDRSTYSNDEGGYRRMAARVASTLLHEMMHNHRFSHAPQKDIPPYDPTLEYYRTLPEVAQHALLQLHSDPSFPAFGSTELLESSSGIVECGA